MVDSFQNIATPFKKGNEKSFNVNIKIISNRVKPQTKWDRCLIS